jgi:tetratricopeptide (TPR) repeat protein/predicted Ser/Thr protein kinase
MSSDTPESDEPPPRTEPYERGAFIGRYVILERLGKGGMGVVYRAFDPELGRAVALKLLHTESAAGGTYRRRLLREAQALARLSHPNVLAVFDVGTFEGNVFIATEFVEGQNLQQWLEQSRRKRREVLEVFLGAGEGLAAAHRAGLVHRDFKPENVMVGQGRVRVVDFGLVRATGSESGDEPVPDSIPNEPAGDADIVSSQDRLLMQLTRAGSILGTPSFMAPEQHRGSAVDERADQYSFCVSLYGALYGAPPFKGDTILELRSNVLAGNVAESPAGARVPRWLRRILLRGLAVNPSDRFASMTDLLAALRADPTAARLRAARYVAVAAVFVAGALVWRAQRREHAQVCRGAEQRLSGIWDDGVRARIRASFSATGAPYAEDTYARVSSVLDAYADNWKRTRTDVCEATHVRGEQSAQLMDLRMQCLDGKAGRFSALTALFAQTPGVGVVERAVEAATRLGDLHACEAGAVTAARPPPADAKARGRVEALRAALDKAEALRHAGQFRSALDQALATATEVHEVGYAPLEAELGLLVGQLQDETRDHAAAEKTFQEAMQAAARAHDDGALASATIELVAVVGRGMDRPLEALALRPLAEAAVVRAGDSPALRTRLLVNLTKVLRLAGNLDEALASAERAVALSEQSTGPNSLQTAEALQTEAGVLGVLDRPEAEREARTRALGILEGQLGPEHPEIARCLMSLGATYTTTGMRERAREMLERALAIAEKSFDKSGGELGEIYLRLGSVAYYDAKFAEAERWHRMALDSFEKAGGPESRRVGMTLYGMSDTLRALGRTAEARAGCERALVILEQKKTLGPGHPLIAFCIECIGSTYREERRYGEAVAALRRALAFLEKSKPDSTLTAFVETSLGMTFMAMGRAADALAPLEHAVKMYENGQVDRGDKGNARFTLARALWQTGGDKTRALDLATRARDDYAAGGELRRKEAALLEAWLKGK